MPIKDRLNVEKAIRLTEEEGLAVVVCNDV